MGSTTIGIDIRARTRRTFLAVTPPFPPFFFPFRCALWLAGRLADRVELHCKDGPFFVSDATPEDLEWMLSAMEAEAVDADGSVLAALGRRR